MGKRVITTAIFVFFCIDSIFADTQGNAAVSDNASDSVGQLLQKSMIWLSVPAEDADKEMFAAFRKQFRTGLKPHSARVHIFGDSCYILWVNGRYVLRGPSRFNPKRPEYDTADVGEFLKGGLNTVAVLVAGNVRDNSRIFRHAPGLAVRLEVVEGNGENVAFGTDGSWRVSSETRFVAPKGRGPSVQDIIDGTREKGDWMGGGFDDSKWGYAVGVDGKKWGRLYRRSIPLLRETEVGPAAVVQVRHGDKIDNAVQPLTETGGLEIKAPAEVVIDMGKLAQAYWVLDYEADAGSEFTVKPCQTFQKNKKAGNNFGVVNRCTAGAGRGQYMSTSTFGFRYMHLELNSGRVRLLGAKFVSVSYPFERIGRFECSDAMLNELWDRATYTVQVCSEDAYVDCALRERAEWMGDGAVVTYPISRVAFACPREEGGYVYGDARLIRNMLRHIAMTQQEDGRIMSNTCFNAGDMHAYIEDYACLWVQALRQYYDNTGDKDFVEELWPVLTGQMKWFLSHRSERGLVRAREFLLHMDNPLHHQEQCEGATLNAFVYQVLKDCAYLAGRMGREEQAREYVAAAEKLARDFNLHLWDEALQTYYAGIKEGEKIAPNRWVDEVTKAYWTRVTDAKEYPATVQAAMMALNRGIVPKERIDSVRKYLLGCYGELNNPYTHFFLFEELYKMNSAERDSDVLQIIRKRWAAMIEKRDPGTLIEKFEFGEGGTSCHNFGAVPAYFLGAYVLGVRTEGAVGGKRIIIEPRLGDLDYAEGAVVTEHGVVPVAWKKAKDGGSLNFSFEIPSGVTAEVSIPKVGERATLVANGEVLVDKGSVKGQAKLRDRFVVLKLGSGKYSGRIGS